MPNEDWLTQLINARQTPNSSAIPPVNNTQSSSSRFKPQFVQSPDRGVQFQSLSSQALINNRQDDNNQIDNRSEVVDLPWLNSDNVQNNGSVEFSEIASAILNPLQQVSTPIQSFQQNILDEYDNVTYHFRLSLAPEQQLLNPLIVPQGPFYVVAESGVSATFSIKNVEIESIVSNSNKTKNTFATKFFIELIEPQGVTFIDKYLSACNSLNIRSPKTCPMLLELSFKGHSQNGLSTEVPIMKRHWRLIINDINTEMDHGGSSYRLECMNAGEYAFNSFANASFIKESLDIKAEKLGQFFDDLSVALSKQNDDLESNKVTKDQYIFNIDQDMREWVINAPKDTPDMPSSQVNMDGSRTITLDIGMTVQEIVDTVIASTKEGTEMVNPSSAPDKMDTNPLSAKIIQVPHITGKVEYLQFRPQINDYDKKYSYYISRYNSYRAIVAAPESPDQSRLMYILRNALQKKYSYIFTGQNTDVLNLDLSMKNLWVHSVGYYVTALNRKNNVDSNFSKSIFPSNDGVDDLLRIIEGNQYGFSPIPSNDVNFSAIPQEIQQNYTPISPDGLPELNPNTSSVKALDKLSSSSADFSSDLQTAVNQTNIRSNPVPLQNIPENLKSQLMLPLAQSSFLIDNLNNSQSIPGIANTPIDAASANAPSGIPVLSTLNTRILSTVFEGFTTPFQISPVLIETLPNVPLNSNPSKSFFVTQPDINVDYQLHKNIENTPDLGKSIFNIVTNQLYGAADTNFMKIDLEIRGDPFWLGESESDSYNRLDNSQITTINSNGLANYLKGENCLFLTFKSPTPYSEESGFLNVQSSDLFVGIYSVVTVNHTFSEGKFTQKLECIRDIQTDASQLRQFIQ